jgi:uncharacterized DUF497 family protein
MKVVFDWDRNKARANAAKHRVSFEEARTIFLDRLTLTRRDEEHSDKEDRLVSIGMSSTGRLLMVVHTEMNVKPELTDKGERGRYYDALQQGHSVRIHEDDGTTTVHYYQLEEGAVLLDPDVREYFPDAKSVNDALRSLIALIPSHPTSGRSRKRTKVAVQ